MIQSEWTQKALAALEREGLIQTGMVNIRYAADLPHNQVHHNPSAYVLQVADQDNAIFELTVREVRA